jgi:AcrR family transcriptional regulator
MNTKNNKRRQQTVAKIQSVFMEELEAKELMQIRVSDICKKAQINRSTFYANYTDVFDLAEQILSDLRQQVASLLELDMEWQYTPDDFLKLLYHIRDHRQLYRFYFCLGYDSEFPQQLNDLYLKHYQIDPALLEYHIAFFKSGFNAMIKKWLEQDCAETPERIQQVLLLEYRGRCP